MIKFERGVGKKRFQKKVFLRQVQVLIIIQGCSPTHDLPASSFCVLGQHVHQAQPTKTTSTRAQTLKIIQKDTLNWMSSKWKKKNLLYKRHHYESKCVNQRARKNIGTA